MNDSSLLVVVDSMKGCALLLVSSRLPYNQSIYRFPDADHRYREMMSRASALGIQIWYGRISYTSRS